MSTTETPIGVFGAAPDTGNLGVSALLYGTLGALAERVPELSPTVFDFGRGIRREVIEFSSGQLEVSRCGAQHTQRIYRPEALTRIRVAARLGGLWNHAARSLLDAAGILDLSGGDSFTDLYGPWRFRSITLPKLIAIEASRPLFLLPQTYGPFQDTDNKREAQKILRRSTMAWARDPWSHDQLRDLLGGDFDLDRHRSGVDVAFLLESRPPGQPLPRALDAILESPGRKAAGINVSGLLYNRSDEAAERHGFKGRYREVIAELVRRFLADTDWSVVLVPHVITPDTHYESDRAAALQLADLLEVDESRLVVAPSYDDPRHVKWLISQFDWFCGTRMHSTIAALSSGVVSAAVAYSDKTRGVFETCGQQEHVADLRRSDTTETVDRLWQAWQARVDSRAKLDAELPAVLDRARSQMEELATAITSMPDRVQH